MLLVVCLLLLTVVITIKGTKITQCVTPSGGFRPGPGGTAPSLVLFQPPLPQFRGRP